MFKLFSELAGRVKERQSSAADRLLAAARKDAAGEKVDLADLEQAFFESGTTLEDFEKLVELQHQRKEHLSRFETLGTLRSKASDVEKRLDAENAKYEETRSGFERRILALHDEHRAAMREVDKAVESREWLVDPEHVGGSLKIGYDAAIAALEGAEVALGSVDSELANARRSLKSEEQFVAELERQSAGNLTGLSHEDLLRHDDHKKRSERLRRRIGELEKDRTASAKDVAEKTRAVEGFRKRILAGKDTEHRVRQ